MKRIDPLDLLGTSPVWCLDLLFGGEVFRLSTEPIDVKAADGTMHSYRGGLAAPEVVANLGRLKFSTPELSAAIRCILPESAAKIRRRGHDWLGATAALYLTSIANGDRRLGVPVAMLSHSEMWLQVAGVVRSPQYAAPGDPAGAVEFTLEVAPWNETSPILPPDVVISSERFPGSGGIVGPPGSEALGKRYPLVFGTPGVYDSGTAPGSPMYAIERDGAGNAVFVLAARGQIDAATLLIYDSAGASASLSPIVFIDGTGETVTYFSVGGGLDPVSGDFYAAWNDGGAFPSPYSAGPLTNAAEVAAYLFGRAGAPVDVPAWLALAGQVSDIQIDGYINDGSTAWEVVSAHVLPLIPVGYRYTRQGLAPVLYDPDMRRGDEVAHVRTVDTPAATGFGDWTPTTGLTLETEPEDVVVRFTANYAKDVQSGAFLRQRSWVGDSIGAPDPAPLLSRRRGGQSGSLYVDQAATRGATTTKSLDLPFVWQTTTADAVLSWRSKLAAMPTESATYEAPWHWGWVQVGDALLVDDSLKGFTGQPALVGSKVWAGDSWEFELIFDEDPVRDPRAID